MKLIDKAASGLETVCTYFITASIATMTVITITEVLRRYFLGLSFAWAEELVRYLLVWVTFIGGSLAFKKGSLVYLDLFLNSLSEKKKVLLSFFVNLLILGFLTVILVISMKYVFSKSILLQTSTGLKLPMTIPYMAIPVGFGFTILFCINNLFAIVGNNRRG